MPKYRLLPLLALLLIGGCAAPVRDRAPADTAHVDFESIPDAVPRKEPRSLYGNPAEYEVEGRRYRVLESGTGFVQRGTASWYGAKFHGRRTSSGERYDLYAMTAAHKELPLPSYVQVTHLETGKSVVVRVNDRGPFHGDRIIDLSYAAARKLGIAGQGTARVEIRTIEPAAPTDTVQGVPAQLTAAAELPVPLALAPPLPQPAAPESPVTATPIRNAASGEARPVPAVTMEGENGITEERLYLQVGAFSERANAERLRDRLVSAAMSASIADADSASALYRVWLGPLNGPDHAAELTERLNVLGITSPRVVRRGRAGL